MLSYISDHDHYDVVMRAAFMARSSLWLATSNLKDAFVERGNDVVSFPARLADLLEKNVEVRLLHGKEPGPRFLEDFDRNPILATDLERRMCPRVHSKLVIVDMRLAYIGSANITGAGLGMKSEHRRNFESGIWTDQRDIVDEVIEHYVRIWEGEDCAQCMCRDVCQDPIA